MKKLLLTSAMLMPAMLNAAPTLLFVNHKTFHQSGPKKVDYLGGIQQTSINDGYRLYTGCYANWTTIFTGPVLGCPLGTTGYVARGDTNGDGISDLGYYLSITSIQPASTVAPFREDVAQLIAAPKSLLARPDKTFNDSSAVIWYNMLSEQVIEYQNTYMFSRRPFANKVEQDKTYVNGTYVYQFARVQRDPFDTNDIYGQFKVTLTPFIDGYPATTKAPSGWRVKNGKWSQRRIELDSRSFSDVIWDGIAKNTSLYSDEMRVSVTSADETIWVVTDEYAQERGFANAAEFYAYGETIGFPITHIPSYNPITDELVGFDYIPVGNPPINFLYTNPITTNGIDPRTGLAVTTPFGHPQPMMYDDTEIPLSDASYRRELVASTNRLNSIGDEGMAPGNIEFPPALREQLINPLSKGYRIPPVGTQKGRIVNLVLNIRRSLLTGNSSYDAAQRAFRIPIRLIDSYAGHVLAEYPYGASSKSRLPDSDYDGDGLKNILEFAYSQDDAVTKNGVTSSDDLSSSLEWTTFNQILKRRSKSDIALGLPALPSGYAAPGGSINTAPPALLTPNSIGQYPILLGTSSNGVSPLTYSTSKRYGVGNSVTYGFEVCYDTTVAKPKWIRLKAPVTGNTAVVLDKKAGSLSGSIPFTWTITNTFDDKLTGTHDVFNTSPAATAAQKLLTGTVGTISISASAALPAKVSIRPTAWVTKGY